MKNSLYKLVLVSILGIIVFLYAKFPNLTDNDAVGIHHVNEEDFLTDTYTHESMDQTPKEEEKKQQEQVVVTKADKIIAIAKSKLNIPYKQAGTTDKGYDCSGLVMTSFKKEGVALPRASYQMATKGKNIIRKDIKKGDLVFFTTNPNTPKRINHVGLVTEVKDDEVYFIHSSTKRGVIINKLSESYYKKSYAKAKRVLK